MYFQFDLLAFYSCPTLSLLWLLTASVANSHILLPLQKRHCSETCLFCLSIFDILHYFSKYNSGCSFSLIKVFVYRIFKIN